MPGSGTTTGCPSRSARAGTRRTRAGSSATSSPSSTPTARASRRSWTTGVSFGAFHAANLALRRADLFPLAICLSGIYDVSAIGWGERGDAVYFNNPADYHELDVWGEDTPHDWPAWRAQIAHHLQRFA
jgi:esterase/lipase superfamily enzyme